MKIYLLTNVIITSLAVRMARDKIVKDLPPVTLPISYTARYSNDKEYGFNTLAMVEIPIKYDYDTMVNQYGAAHILLTDLFEGGVNEYAFNRAQVEEYLKLLPEELDIELYHHPVADSMDWSILEWNIPDEEIQNHEFVRKYINLMRVGIFQKNTSVNTKSDKEI